MNLDGETALMMAAQNGHEQCVQLLVPFELKIQDDMGWTALMSAAQAGHLNCVKLLLGEAEIYNSENCTALDIALIERGKESKVKNLNDCIVALRMATT